MLDVLLVGEDLVEQLEVDRPAEDRGPAEQGPTAPIEAIDAAREQGLETIGQRLGRPVLHGDGGQLAGEERVAGGPFHDRVEVRVRERRPAGGIEGEPDDRVRIEGAEVDPRGSRTAERRAPPGAGGRGRATRPRPSTPRER